MSTVREHLQALRDTATALEQHGLSGHGHRQDNRSFQFHSVLLCGVHLEELEAMVNDRQRPADLTDTQIKALVDDSPELVQLPYGAAYKLVRKIEAAANAGVPGTQKPVTGD